MMLSSPQLARARRLRAGLRKRKALEIGLDYKNSKKAAKKYSDNRMMLSSPQLARARRLRAGLREREALEIGLD